jgi:tetratricopeptide (TPR) repeat protein
LKIACKINPLHYESCYNLGKTYFLQKNYSAALTAFGQASILNDASADLHYNLGNVYEKVQSYEEARNSYLRCIVIDPFHAKSHCNLGIIQKHLDSNSKSTLIYYERAISINPDLTEAYINRGEFYKDMNITKGRDYTFEFTSIW